MQEQVLHGNLHLRRLRHVSSGDRDGQHRQYLFVSAVVLAVLSLARPTDSVKLTFVKNEVGGKKIFSVEDATIEAPTPREGSIIVAALSTCHNTLRRVAIRNTWGKFPGRYCFGFPVFNGFQMFRALYSSLYYYLADMRLTVRMNTCRGLDAKVRLERLPIGASRKLEAAQFARLAHYKHNR